MSRSAFEARCRATTGGRDRAGAIKLVPTRCAICGPAGEAAELYPARLEPAAFSARVFSARRPPDRLHYRMVRCRRCGLVRSDPIAENAVLQGLYADSLLNYEAESANLRRTYGRCLARLERYGAVKGSLLEIGCGHGFFLEEALAQGYGSVRGVEPSRAAVAKCPQRLRPQVVCDLFRAGLFPQAAFDVLCMFQVFDHVPEPAAFLDECLRVLRPGGLLLALNHDIQALPARMLGQRSPIIDVEHTFLYSPGTMRRLFARRGFEVLEVRPVWNRCALEYVSRLVPLPPRVRQWVERLLSATGLGRLAVTVPLGNLCLIARKPARSGPRKRTAA
jgi:SAM-dependent methyltransferase